MSRIQNRFRIFCLTQIRCKRVEKSALSNSHTKKICYNAIDVRLKNLSNFLCLSWKCVCQRVQNENQPLCMLWKCHSTETSHHFVGNFKLNANGCYYFVLLHFPFTSTSIWIKKAARLCTTSANKLRTLYLMDPLFLLQTRFSLFSFISSFYLAIGI